LKLLNKPIEDREYILIGKIIGVHGLRGTNKLLSYAESLSIFKPGGCILVRRPNSREKPYTIDWVKPHSKNALVCLKEVTDRDAAEDLVGSQLFIAKAELPELDPGIYYWFDLIGLDVFTTEEEYLGRIESIIETGSNDVYVVKTDDAEILIPALESVVLSIDLEGRRMQVDLPEGLL
jgi:16S rRNA processing protein RimM